MATLQSKTIKSFKEISTRYDYLIFDVSGVLTNGGVVFPNAVSCLQTLQKLGKTVILLSNAPRTSIFTGTKLQEAGIDTKNLITSGEFMLADLEQGQVFKNWSAPCYVLGDRAHNTLFNNDNQIFNFVEKLEDAQYFIIAKFMDSLAELAECEKVLQKALDLNLPAICPNPDRTVYFNEQLRYPQGYLADLYKNMGGEVYFYGKPHVEIYNFTGNKFAIQKEKAVMIGDNIYTDVRGAKNYGIDSILVTLGNHRADNIETLCKIEGIFPEYLINEVIF